MSKLYLCLEVQCKAPSRYIDDPLIIHTKSSFHYGHQCEELSELQARLKKFEKYFNTRSINLMTQTVSDKFNQLKQSNALQLDQLVTELQKIVESNRDVHSINIIRAVLKSDFHYLRDKQNYFQILNQPELIFNAQDKRLSDLILKFPSFYQEIHEQFTKEINIDTFLNVGQVYEQKILSQQIQLVVQDSASPIDIKELDEQVKSNKLELIVRQKNRVVNLLLQKDIKYDFDSLKQQFIDIKEFQQAEMIMKNLSIKQYQSESSKSRINENLLESKLLAQSQKIIFLQQQLSNKQQDYSELKNYFTEMKNKLEVELIAETKKVVELQLQQQPKQLDSTALKLQFTEMINQLETKLSSENQKATDSQSQLKNKQYKSSTMKHQSEKNEIQAKLIAENQKVFDLEAQLKTNQEELFAVKTQLREVKKQFEVQLTNERQKVIDLYSQMQSKSLDSPRLKLAKDTKILFEVKSPNEKSSDINSQLKYSYLEYTPSHKKDRVETSNQLDTQLTAESQLVIDRKKRHNI